MGILGVQIISITFSVFMIYFTYHAYRRQHFEIYSLIIWLLVFSGLIIFTLLPSIFLPVLQLLKIARLFDFFLIAGIFFLITISYINFLHIEKLKRKIDRIVQDKALKDD